MSPPPFFTYPLATNLLTPFYSSCKSVAFPVFIIPPFPLIGGTPLGFPPLSKSHVLIPHCALLNFFHPVQFCLQDSVVFEGSPSLPTLLLEKSWRVPHGGGFWGCWSFLGFHPPFPPLLWENGLPSVFLSRGSPVGEDFVSLSSLLRGCEFPFTPPHKGLQANNSPLFRQNARP